MAYLNKVMLIGNIGKDPEIRLGQSSGRKCATFSLATSKRYRDANGEQKEITTWHNIVGWGKIADIVEQLRITKGTALYVEGEITNRSWTDTSGAKRYTTEVNMDTFQLLTPRNAQPQQQQAPSQSDGNPYAPGGYGTQPMNGFQSGPDDDLPF